MVRLLIDGSNPPIFKTLMYDFHCTIGEIDRGWKITSVSKVTAQCVEA
jgi:hypothetical protein